LKAVRVFINRLKTDTLLDTDQGTARTLITICNYERYQDPHNVTGTQMGTTRGTAGAQQGHSRGTQKKEGNTVKEVNTEEGIDIGLTPSLEAEPSSSVDASSADELLRTATVTQLKAPKDASLAVALWNAMAAECGISPVSTKIKPGSTRSVHLMARLREGGGIEGWKAALERVRESPFLLGQSEREWVVSFDWLIKPSNFVKVIEGVYRRVTPKPRAAPKSNAELLAERMGYGRPAQTASGPFDNPPTIDGEAINA
jgi:hypothetical protein